MKYTTESNTPAFYLNLFLSIGRDGPLRTSPYDKHDDLKFYITNFPFLISNIHLRNPMVCLSHSAYGLPGLAPLMIVHSESGATLCKLLGQRYVRKRLKASLRKFCVRYGDLVEHYEVSLSQMLHDILGHDHIQ